MSPRQRLTPRCSAKPTRHPAHLYVYHTAVSKKQLALRLTMMILVPSFAHRLYVNVVLVAQVRNVARNAATARFQWTTVLSLISWFSFGREITVDFQWFHGLMRSEMSKKLVKQMVLQHSRPKCCNCTKKTKKSKQKNKKCWNCTKKTKIHRFTQNHGPWTWD